MPLDFLILLVLRASVLCGIVFDLCAKEYYYIQAYIVSSMKSHEKRKLWSLETDFISQPEFFNTLPSAPSGPFFRKIPLSSFTKSSKFKASSLEKSYIWQPHLQEAGIQLDLVDQESILIPNRTLHLNPMDAKYINAADSTNRKNRKLTADEKPWWLRNTVYLENNLYGQRRPCAKDEADLKAAALALSVKNSTKFKDPYLISNIEDSFHAVTRHVTSDLKKHVPAKDARIEWSVPIYPDAIRFAAPHLQVRFDENVQDMYARKCSMDNMNYDAGRAIITNLRQQLTSEHASTKTFYASLVSPELASSAAPSDKKIKKKSTEDDDVDALFEDEEEEEEEVKEEAVAFAVQSNKLNQDGSLTYHWISDFKMEISGTRAGDEFLLQVPDVNDLSAGAVYWPVRTRIDMRKLPVEDWSPLEVSVHRGDDGLEIVQASRALQRQRAAARATTQRTEMEVDEEEEEEDDGEENDNDNDNDNNGEGMDEGVEKEGDQKNDTEEAPANVEKVEHATNGKSSEDQPNSKANSTANNNITAAVDEDDSDDEDDEDFLEDDDDDGDSDSDDDDNDDNDDNEEEGNDAEEGEEGNEKVEEEE